MKYVLRMEERTRVLFIWPWFRTLAINYANLIDNKDFEARIITTSKSWDNDDSPLILKSVGSFKVINFAWESWTIYRTAKKFHPHIVFTEHFSDPRFMLLRFIKVKVVMLALHDVIKHGPEDELKGMRRFSSQFVNLKYDEVCTFSKFSQNQMRESRRVTLLPEYPIQKIPKYNVNIARKNFVTFGRINPYKNLEWLATNWESISTKLGFEELHIYGYGDSNLTGNRVRHFNQRFDRDELVESLSNYRCALFPYISGTQSGTLLLAHLGSLASLTTNLPGFREYQNQNLDFINDPQSLEEIQEKLTWFMDDSYASNMAKSAHKLVPVMIKRAQTEFMDLLNNLLIEYSA